MSCHFWRQPKKHPQSLVSTCDWCYITSKCEGSVSCQVLPHWTACHYRTSSWWPPPHWCGCHEPDVESWGIADNKSLIESSLMGFFKKKDQNPNINHFYTRRLFFCVACFHFHIDQPDFLSNKPFNPASLALIYTMNLLLPLSTYLSIFTWFVRCCQPQLSLRLPFPFSP